MLALVPSHHNHALGEKIGIRLDVDHVVAFRPEAQSSSRRRRVPQGELLAAQRGGNGDSTRCARTSRAPGGPARRSWSSRSVTVGRPLAATATATLTSPCQLFSRERRIAAVPPRLVDELHAVLVARHRLGYLGERCLRGGRRGRLRLDRRDGRRAATGAGAGAGTRRGASTTGGVSSRTTVSVDTGFGARGAGFQRFFSGGGGRARADSGAGGSISRAARAAAGSHAARCRRDSGMKKDEGVQRERRANRVMERAVIAPPARHLLSGRERHFEVRDADRVEHRVHYCRHGADRAELAAAFHAEQVRLARHAVVGVLHRRQLVGARHAVVHERSESSWPLPAS